MVVSIIYGDDDDEYTYEDINNGDVPNPPYDDVIKKLEQAYQKEISDKIQYFQEIFDNDYSGKKMSMFKNLKNIKDTNEFQDNQNESTKIAFMERYLFLIVKVLFFIILLIIFLYKIRDQLVFNFNFKNIQQQVLSISKKTNESIPSLRDKPSQSNSFMKRNMMNNSTNIQKNNS